MKNKRAESFRWLIVTVAAALLCAAARRWQLSTAFEGSLSLPIPRAPATMTLVVLLIVSAVVLFLLSRRQPVTHSLGETPELALHAENDTIFMVAVVTAAFLALAAAPVLFRDGSRMWTAFHAAKSYGGSIPGGNNGVLTLCAAVTSLLAFLGLLMGGKASYRSTVKGRLGILVPAVNGCLWLMEVYRGNAADPVQWNYAPLLLAIVSGILFYLDWAGLNAGVFAPRRTLWIAGMTVVLSAAALAGNWDLSSALLLTSQLIAALAVLWCVPGNLRYPPEPAVEEAPEEEKLEEEPHE